MAINSTSIRSSQLPYPHKDELSKDEKKWKKLGLDLELFRVNPSSAKFLIQSRLIFMIIGLSNTFPQAGHDILENGEDLMIKVNGVFTPVSEFRKDIQYDCEEKSLFSIENDQKQYWSYAGERGLIPYDPFGKEPLIPIGRLTNDERLQLGLSSRCLIQIVTRPTPCKLGPIQAGSWVLNGWSQMSVGHVGFRLISEAGDVYSTGLSVLREEKKDHQGRDGLVTTNATLMHMDYGEISKADGAVITNVEISPRQFEQVLNLINQKRDEVLRFNIFQQNCAKFAASILQMVDVNIDSRISLLEAPFIVLPGGSFIYNSLGSVVRLTKIAVGKIFPSFISYYLFCLTSHITSIVKAPFNLIANSALIILGASRGTERKNRERSSQNINGESFEMRDFETLMSQNWGIAGSDSQRIHHPMRIVQWQLRQEDKTFFISKKNKPSFDVFPKDWAESDRQIQALRKIFL